MEPTIDPTDSPALHRALTALVREHPLERKLLVAPAFGAGRELLRRLALESGGWVGFEVTTVRPLALRIAQERLDAQRLSVIDAFEQQELLDEALDATLATSAGAAFRELSEGVGFRGAVHEAVAALRLAGVDPAALRAARTGNWRKRLLLSQVAARYQALLSERRRADTATVLALAGEALQERARPFEALTGADRVVLMPGLGARGLTGRLLDALHLCGAQVLPTDAVMGMEPPRHLLWFQEEPASALSFFFAPGSRPEASRPSIELFRAACPTDELREVFRRVLARGVAWDDVEIIAPDPVAYGSALHALCETVGARATYAVGLPVERTRAGRAVATYLEWLRGGFQAVHIRRLLEAGDLVPRRSHGRHAPADLARRFRSLRVGWGRRRYRSQIRDALEALDRATPGAGEDPERFRRRVERARSELKALRGILFPTLRETPSVPDRLGEGGRPVSPAELARGLRAFLQRVRKGTGPDAAAREEFSRRLERIEATLRRRTDFQAAVSILQRHLEFRVRPPGDAGTDVDDQGAPWRSEGGSVHLSDLEHGGLTGRREVFIVGLDADALPGPGTQDAMLLDVERRALGEGLPTSADVTRERLFRFAALLARLRGRVTLSYSAWNAADARTVAPSPLLLQALRLRAGDARLTFRDLDAALGRVVSAVPGAGLPPLDVDDVWMHTLSDGAGLKRGSRAVRAAFPALDAGLGADEVRWGVPSAHQGVVTPRPDLLDPRRNPEVVLSAGRLEDLGACPLRYLLKSVLRLRPPDDPSLDPDQWLDPLQRGSLLHGVFETALRKAKEEGVRPSQKAFADLAQEALEDALRRAVREIPCPGEGVRRRERVGLEEDVRSFVRLIRDRSPEWVALELRFGFDGDEVVLAVPGGEVRLRGAVDRVDEDLQGLHVVDYKTGQVRGYGPGTGAFHGGRRLQHAVYARVVESVLGGEVATGEYHFPTRRGLNTVIAYDRLRLLALPELVEILLDGVAAGAFLPTDDKEDCTFCDYRPVCRVQGEGGRNLDSPRAEWSKEHLATGLQPAVQHLGRARRFEE